MSIILFVEMLTCFRFSYFLKFSGEFAGFETNARSSIPCPNDGGREYKSVVDKSAEDQGDISHTQLVQLRYHAEMSHRRMLVPDISARENTDGAT